MTISPLGYPESEIQNFLILFLCVPGPRGMGPGRGARAPSPGPGSRARAPGPGLGLGARTRAAGPGARAPAPSPARGRGPGPGPQASFWLLEYKMPEWENGGENTHAHTHTPIYPPTHGGALSCRIFGSRCAQLQRSAITSRELSSLQLLVRDGTYIVSRGRVQPVAEPRFEEPILWRVT